MGAKAGHEPEPLTITVDGHTIEVSNPDKVLFPESGKTKADLARYYAEVGPTMLPHMAGRPVTLVRHPSGIAKKGFFQKNTPAHYPDWIPRVELAKRGGTVNHAVVDTPAALVYFAQQNVITPHIGLAPIESLRTPNLVVVDLDPSDTTSEGAFDRLRSVAHGVRDGMERAGLVAFVQLTGSKGLHIVAPIEPTADYRDVRKFTTALVTLLTERFPDDVTSEFHKAERGDRIYLDLGRNTYQATFAAPYGIRAIEGAPVVTPITWDELDDPETHPRRFTIATIPERLAAVGDPWAELRAAARPVPGGPDATTGRTRQW